MDYDIAAVLRVIDKYSHNMYIVNRNDDICCTCFNFDTKQGKPDCPKCLGTGHQIKIKKVFGAGQDGSLPTSLKNSNPTVGRNYYFKSDIQAEQDDIIIDGDEVFYIFQTRKNFGDHGEFVYKKCLSAPKKLNDQILLKNFYKIIRGV